DCLVHSPEPSVMGHGSPMIGLGLWRHPVTASVVEAAIAFVGVGVYLNRAEFSQLRRGALVGLMGAVTLFSLTSLFQPMKLPVPRVLATTSLATICFVIAFAVWVDRPKQST